MRTITVILRYFLRQVNLVNNSYISRPNDASIQFHCSHKRQHIRLTFVRILGQVDIESNVLVSLEGFHSEIHLHVRGKQTDNKTTGCVRVSTVLVMFIRIRSYITPTPPLLPTCESVLFGVHCCHCYCFQFSASTT